MMCDRWSRWWQSTQRRVAVKRCLAARQPPWVLSPRLSLEELESRRLLSAADPLSSAIPISLSSSQPQQGVSSPTPTYYAFTVTDSGRLTAEVVPSGGPTRLTLLSSAGEALMQSDGQSPENPNDLIDLHLRGAADGITYYLRVEGLGEGTTTYTLTTGFSPAVPPFQPLPVGDNPSVIVTGDFNADGRLDIASSNVLSKDVSILLGQGDGTFAPAMQFTIDKKPYALVTGDFNGDGNLDLVTGHTLSTTAGILLGRGDGTFNKATLFEVGSGVTALATGDLNGDGKLDLVMGRAATDSVSVLLGRGNGAFADQVPFAAGAGVAALVVGDFNGDGYLDLVAANSLSNNVSVLLGRGDGTFAAQVQFAAGAGVAALVIGDFNRDGRLDLAAANSGSDNVSVLLGRGDGTLADQVQFAAGEGVASLVVGDFNGDGHLDLATANSLSNSVSVLLGRGNGTFADQVPLALARAPGFLAVADFNGDGSLDLASAHATADQVSVFLGLGNGTFQSPDQDGVDGTDFSFTTADFDNDGRLDLASAGFTTNRVQVLLGRQDGTFALPWSFATGLQPRAVVAGDFNGDGSVDLATANAGADDVAVLLGRGDGTFASPLTLAAGSGPIALVVGDWNTDGHLDLAVLNNLANDISVFLGRGDGTFTVQVRYAVGSDPKALSVGDFNGDGRLDLITTNDDKTMSVLLGRGDGTFASQAQYATRNKNKVVVTADFNGDGRLDCATSSPGSSELSVFLGRGDGTFDPPKSFKVGPGRYYLTTLDVDRDGHLDLVAASYQANSVFLYLGQGDGTFRTDATFVVGSGPAAIRTEDFNGDGQLDLLTANIASSDVSVLLNQGDGTFRAALRTAVATGPVALAAADFNGDGHSDLVTANPTTQNVELAFSNGDGTFQTPRSVPLRRRPIAVTAGDFNRDGRADLAVVHYRANTVTILLSDGDGTFVSPLSYPVGNHPVGNHPVALVTADFNHDGIADLAVANYRSSTVSILLGRGDGTFTAGQEIAVGEGPIALAVGDLNGDGQADLGVASSLARSLSILAGSGDGTFQVSATTSLGTTPNSVVLGDWNGDGKLDLASADQARSTVAVLLGKGDGTFQAPVQVATGLAPVSLVVGDFNRDDRLDLATANNNANNVTVLLGKGDGTFQAQAPFDVGSYPLALLAGDFNGDGRLDLATANGLGQPVSVGLGLGNGTLIGPDKGAHPLRAIPQVGDLNGDGLPDVAILAGNGRILVRFNHAGAPGTYQPPIVLNPDPADRARDLTLVSVNGRQELAALDARTNTISFYRYEGNSRFVHSRGPRVPADLPVRIVAGDLDGDARQDLVVASSSDSSSGAITGRIDVYLQQPDGTFGPAGYERDVGVSPSDLALVNLAGGRGPDIVVTDQNSGQIHLLRNAGTAPFTTALSFRAGTGLYEVTQEGDRLAVASREAPSAFVAGAFGGGATPDLIVLNRGTDRFDLLRGDGHGGVFNPLTSTRYQTGRDSSAIVAGDFNGDDLLDLAVLDRRRDQVLLYRGDGTGGFVPEYARSRSGRFLGLESGNASDGLAVADVNGDGHLDFLVGNTYGDVLFLLGNGDSTFAPYQRLDRRVALAVADVNNDQQVEFVFANRSLDRVSVQSSQSGQVFQQGRQDDVLAPNTVKLADLSGDGLPDLIVANGGGNNILVYLGRSNGEFASAQRFAVGTNPVGVTVGDLNGDGIPDLVVANQGSNDVSILVGQRGRTSWTLTHGPRLQAGTGPVATVVQDTTGDGIPDILVANSVSNTVYQLAGLGRGFFDDANPVIYQTGDAPVNLFVDHFDNQPGLDLVTVNAQSHDLTFFSGFGPGRTISPGGTDPVAALAADFNHDGTSDLIVAGSDGHFTLLLGGADGPQVTTRLALPNLLNVSDIVLGSMDGSTVAIYASMEGEEVATPVTFLLDFAPFLPPNVTSPELTLPDTPSSPVAEFSSPAASSLEILVTLLLAPSDAGLSLDTGPSADLGPVSDLGLTFELGPTSQVVPVASVVERGEAEGDETAGLMVAQADEPAGGVERNLFITGADEIPILQEQDSTEDTELPDVEVPFPSPLELFDFRPQVSCTPHWQEIVAEVSRWTAAGETSSEPGDQDEHWIPTWDWDIPPLGLEWDTAGLAALVAGSDQVPFHVAAAEAGQSFREEKEGPALPDQGEAEPAPHHTARCPALAFWLGWVFLGQNRPAPLQRAQPKNPRRA